MPNARTYVLKELVRDSHYVVDEVAVAESIIVRAMARRVAPELVWRQPRRPDARSFRRAPSACSFKLAAAPPR